MGTCQSRNRRSANNQSPKIQTHNEDSIYRGCLGSLASPYVPPSPPVDKRRWCMYSAQSHFLPIILSSTNDYANDAGDRLDRASEHMSARPSYISLASSWRTSTSTLGSSSSSIGSSVLGRGARPFEEEEQKDEADEGTKTEESGEVNDVDDAIRQEREKTLQILTSRADEVEGHEMIRPDAGRSIDGNGQCGMMKEVTGLAGIGREKRALGEGEISGPLISYIQGNEGALFKAVMSDVSD